MGRAEAQGLGSRGPNLSPHPGALQTPQQSWSFQKQLSASDALRFLLWKHEVRGPEAKQRNFPRVASNPAPPRLQSAPAEPGDTRKVTAALLKQAERRSRDKKTRRALRISVVTTNAKR